MTARIGTRLARRSQPLLLGAAGLAGTVVLWDLAVRSSIIDVFFVSTPGRVAAAAARQASSGALGLDLGVTLAEFGAGFGLAAATGLALGLLMAANRRLQYALEPFVWFQYTAPTIAFFPLFIIVLGLGYPTVIALAFLFAFVPILTNVVAGVRATDPLLLRVAASFGATRRDLFLRVALPSAIPLIVAGLRIGVGRAFLGVIVGEMFSGTEGLGYRLAYHGARLRTDDMFAPLVVVVLLGILFTQGFRLFEHLVSRWQSA